MNPIDDYSAVRPDHVAPSQEELDQLWERVLTTERSPASEGEPSVDAQLRRRRLALLGAAASLVVGVTAVALVADRAQAPTGVSDTAPESSVAMPVEESDPAAPVGPPPVGPPPVWTVSEAGWVPAEPVVAFESSVANVTLVAGPAGVATSWVAIVDGVSDPLMGVGGLGSEFPQMPVVPEVEVPGSPPPSVVATPPADDPSESDAPIIAWRTDPATGNYVVSAGGVSRSEATQVFDAVRAGTEPPAGFAVLPEASGALAQRRVTQRFDHSDGRWIEIDIQSGGQPRYDVELQSATAVEAFDPPEGVDVSNIAFPDEYTLLLRTGFWVSTVRTSASTGPAADFTAMVELVELDDLQTAPVSDVSTSLPVTAAPRATTSPADTDVGPIERLAIGDSVMLGAAQQLIELDLVVDAVESRAFVDGLDFVRTLAEEGRLPETMVVHLGGNGPIGEASMDELLRLVDDVETVVLVTSAIDRDYNEANTELIFEYAATQHNVEVLDWSGLAADCPGDCFEADGFHLKPDGRGYYAGLVGEALAQAGA